MTRQRRIRRMLTAVGQQQQQQGPASPNSSSKSRSSSPGKMSLLSPSAVRLLVALMVAGCLRTLHLRQRHSPREGERVQYTADWILEVLKEQDAKFNNSDFDSVAARLHVCDESSLDGYASVRQLVEGLGTTAWFVVHQVAKEIPNGLSVGGFDDSYSRRCRDGYDRGVYFSEPRDSWWGSAAAPIENERTMREEETVVSDGRHLFVANQQNLTVLDSVTGTLVAQILLPDASPGDHVREIYYGYNMDSVDVIRPTIVALLLHRGRVAVVSRGHGPARRHQFGVAVNNGTRRGAVLSGFLDTLVQVYTIESILESQNASKPLFSLNLHGCYQSLRADSKGHVRIVTQTGLNTRTYLSYVLERWQERLRPMNNTEYTNYVLGTARNTTVPAFVSKVVLELQMSDAGIPDLFKHCRRRFENAHYSSDGAMDSAPLDNLALVQSFDMMTTVKSDTGPDTPVAARSAPPVSSAGVMFPGRLDAFPSARRVVFSVLGEFSSCAVQKGCNGPMQFSTAFLSLRFAVNSRGEPAAVFEAVGGTDGRMVSRAASLLTDEGYLWVVVQQQDSLTGRWVKDMVVLSMPVRNKSGAISRNISQLSRTPIGSIAYAVRAIPGGAKMAHVLMATPGTNNITIHAWDMSDPRAPRWIAAGTIGCMESHMLHRLEGTLALSAGSPNSGLENVPWGAKKDSTRLKLNVFDLSPDGVPTLLHSYVTPVVTEGQYSNSYFWPLPNGSATIDTAEFKDFQSLRVVPNFRNTNASLVAVPVNAANWWPGGYSFDGYWTFLVNRTHIIKHCELGYWHNGAGVYTRGARHEAAVRNRTGLDFVEQSCYYCGVGKHPRALSYFRNSTADRLVTVCRRYVRGYNLETCELDWKLTM